MRSLGAALLLTTTLLACGSHPPTFGPPDHVVTFDGASGVHRLDVQVADTDAERAQGLKGIRSLPADQGMAFVFGGSTTASFWMKDTLIPLSIAFVDSGGRVVTIEEMKPCHADPCPTYVASSPYTMAVEANAGWFARAGIAVGDRAELGPVGG